MGIIEGQKNDYNKKIDAFSPDIESFLCISKPPSSRPDKKPLNIMWHYSQGKIKDDKLKALKEKVENLM